MFIEFIEQDMRFVGRSLDEGLKDRFETYVIGDANGVAQALEAVRAAYELGYKL